MALLTGRDLSTMQLNLLTERSRKFYDGTYKWISCEGFMDEEGVYRDFDDTLDARPPTPLPTPLLSDDEDDVAHDPAPSVLLKTLPRNDLFLDKDETTRNRLNGRLEGIQIGQWLGRGLSLADAYRKVGLEYPDAIVDAGLGHEEPGEPAKSPFSDISGMTDVSDPPSELQSPGKVRQVSEIEGEPYDDDKENEGDDAGRSSSTRFKRIIGQGKPLQDSTQGSSQSNRSAGKGHAEGESMVGDELEAEDKPTKSKKRKATGNDEALPCMRGDGSGGLSATRRSVRLYEKQDK